MDTTTIKDKNILMILFITTAVFLGGMVWIESVREAEVANQVTTPVLAVLEIPEEGSAAYASRAKDT